HPSSHCMKRARRRPRFIRSGEGGIRTHGRFWRHGLANRSLGPLGHLSPLLPILPTGAAGFEPAIPGLTVRCFASSATPHQQTSFSKPAARSRDRSLTTSTDCPARGRTWTFLIQSQACCQLHHGAPKPTKSGRRGSNPRPSAWEADALPTELLPH